MNIRKIFLVFLFSLCIVQGVFASNHKRNFGTEISGVEDDADDVFAVVEQKRKTSLYIKTDVSGAQIYVNGYYYGNDELSFDDIKPGHYFIEAVKAGYEKSVYEVYLREGEKKSVYVHLELIKGFIEFLNYLEGASVMVDGTYVSSKLLEIGAGVHSVRVKKFGYKDLNTTVNVAPYETTALNIDLEEADFSFNNFSVSRDKINPDVNGLKNTVFSFMVTASKPVTISVCDVFGNPVRTFSVENFVTWENSVKWDGCDDEGNRLADGNYSISVDVAPEISRLVKIDSDFRYTVKSFTYSGGGIGTLPAAYNNSKADVTPFVLLEPMFKVNNSAFSFEGCLIDTGVLFGIGRFVECGISVGSQFGLLPIFPFFLNASIKGGAGIELGGAGSGNYLNFAGLVRYGFSNFDMEYYGGRGLGTGVAVGFENKYLYCGLSSEVSFGIRDGNVADGSSEWKNGLAFSFNPTDFSHLSVWGAYVLNSYFDFGIEYIVMPAANGFTINFATKMVLIPGKTFYFSEKILLSYFF